MMKIILTILILLFMASVLLAGVFGKNTSDITESFFFGLKKLTEKTIFLSTLALHFLGKIGILIILGSSLLILFNEIAVVLKLSPLIEGESYESLLSLFSKPHTWAAATAIIAATTAITTSKKFEMDREEDLHKRRERNDARYQRQLLAGKDRVDSVLNRSLGIENNSCPHTVYAYV